MGGTHYIPRREAELVDWSRAFEQGISEDPVSIGLTAEQAMEYSILHTAWVDAYVRAAAPGTRGPWAIQGKNIAKRALVRKARELARIIQSHPGTTDVQRLALGLTVLSPYRTPIGPPKFAPRLSIYSVLGQQVFYRLRDTGETSRLGKPTGVAGAMVYCCVGDKAPPNLDAWQLFGNVTRTKGVAKFAATAVPPGSKVWLSAAWYNPRGQQGPLAVPEGVYLAGGLTQDTAKAG